jgi:hypothetical protein
MSLIVSMFSKEFSMEHVITVFLYILMHVH